MAVAGQVEHPELLATQEVSFRSEGTKIPAYLARPRERGRYPGIILIHDIFGVSDHARDVARRLANVGFAALVPDCFARIDLGTGESLEDVRPRAALLDDRLTVSDLENAAALLRSLPYCSGKIGTVGFVWAGVRPCCSHVAATRLMRPSIAGAAGLVRIRR
jgi:carboxymethylenebutenolidase